MSVLLHSDAISEGERFNSVSGAQRRNPLLFNQKTFDYSCKSEGYFSRQTKDKRKVIPRGSNLCTDIKETIGWKQTAQCGKKCRA